MKDLQNLLSASTAEELNEASLSRIYKYFQNSKEKGFAILTSWRQDNSPQQNNADFKELKRFVKTWNLTFFNLRGHGQEDQVDPKTGETVTIEAIEPSLFVIGITLSQAKKIMIQYNQFCILYCGPETEGKPTLVMQDGQKQAMSKFHPGLVSKFFSKIKNKPFFFEYTFNTVGEGLYQKLNKGKKISGVTRWFES